MTQPNLCEQVRATLTALFPRIINAFMCVCLLALKAEAVSNNKICVRKMVATDACFKNCAEMF